MDLAHHFLTLHTKSSHAHYVSGFRTITSGLSKPRKRIVWHLMKPYKWMSLSSENHTLSKKSGFSYTMAKNHAQYSILRGLSCSVNHCPTCIRYENPPKFLTMAEVTYCWCLIAGMFVKDFGLVTHHLIDDTSMIFICGHSYWPTRLTLPLTQYTTLMTKFCNDRQHNCVAWCRLIKVFTIFFSATDYKVGPPW